MCKPEAFNHSSRLPKELQKIRKISSQRSKLIVKISKIAVFVTRIRYLKGIYIYKILKGRQLFPNILVMLRQIHFFNTSIIAEQTECMSFLFMT